MRELERDFGLQRVAPSIEAERKAPTRGEIEEHARTGQPSARQQLQPLCDAAAKDCGSFTVYQERLEAVGVELVPVTQIEGAKLSGLSYRLDGVTMKGSDLGKAYSPAGLAKRGVTYEQGRDFAAVRRSNERNEVRAFDEPDRDREAGQAAERGGLGFDAGTVGAGNGSTSRRDTADAGRDQPPVPGTGRAVQQPGQRSSQELEGSRHFSTESRRPSERVRYTDGVETLRLDHNNGSAYSSARERVLALAGTADRAESVRRASGGQLLETGRDRSLEAVQRQITALDVPRFDVGIREAKSGQMMNREWSRDELEQSTAWLKRMNAKGHDVYIRPAGKHGLVLVDDLKPDALDRMKREGFAPAATLETSPGTYQAWVKFSDKPLSPTERHIASHGLEKRYGGDVSNTYGRLAGFTNQEPQHTRDGRQPYVLAHDCPGKTAPAASGYLEHIRLELGKTKQLELQKKLQKEQEQKQVPEKKGPVWER